MNDRGNAEAARQQVTQHVTLLLEAAASGDSRASAELLPLVYAELRKLAQSNMQKESAAHNTLQPTALVHEAYMRLVGNDQSWNGRGHFFGAAALAMRRILIERARARHSQKRGGHRPRVELQDDAVAYDAGAAGVDDARSDELVALDGALERLQTLDERAAQIVMLRYFAGLSIEQTAAALDLSPATVKKSWAFARAWLNREIAASQSS